MRRIKTHPATEIVAAKAYDGNLDPRPPELAHFHIEIPAITWNVTCERASFSIRRASAAMASYANA
jgi:hypothetical protein